MAVDIPVLPQTKVYRGDILTTRRPHPGHHPTAAKTLGYADRPTDGDRHGLRRPRRSCSARLFGALVLRSAGIPITLSTSGGALIAGIIFGWLRTVRPTFGRIPRPTSGS